VVIDQANPIQLDLGPDVSIELGDSLILTPIISNAEYPLEYEWTNLGDSIGCNQCQTVTVQPSYSTSYALALTDEYGCASVDDINIIVDRERKVYIPNAFSPNYDGINDRFTIYARPGTIIESLQVYDRWGALVFQGKGFEPNDESMGWDGFYRGELMNPDAFIWFAQIRFIDDEVELFEGDVTLIR